MPRHYLHDGPFFNAGPATKPAASIGALQWAAERAGQSFGRFILGLTESDQRRIQTEFDTFQAEKARKRRVLKRGERKKAERQRTQPRVTTEQGSEGLIITDGDV